MADADRQGQGQGEGLLSAGAAPSLSDRALFLKLRKCEVAAYCNVLRAFVGQGLALDASRRRMLDDLRAMLFVSERRHHSELAAAQADGVLQAISSKGLGAQRAQFSMQPLCIEDGEEEGLQGLSDGSDTDDSTTLGTGRPPRRQGRRQKRQRVTRGPESTEFPRPVESVSGASAVVQAQTYGPNPFLALTLPELEEKLLLLEGEVTDLERSLSTTVDATRQAFLKANLLSRLREVDHCIEALSSEQMEAAGPQAVPEKVEQTQPAQEASLAGMSRRITALQQKINELQMQLNDSQDDLHKAKIKKELEVRLEELTAMINELVDDEEDEEEVAPGAGTNSAAVPDGSEGAPAVPSAPVEAAVVKSASVNPEETSAGSPVAVPATGEDAEDAEMLEAMVGVVAAAAVPPEAGAAGDQTMSEDELEGDMLGDHTSSKDEAGGDATAAELRFHEEDEPSE